jgi:hypothetical protein
MEQRLTRTTHLGCKQLTATLRTGAQRPTHYNRETPSAIECNALGIHECRFGAESVRIRVNALPSNKRADRPRRHVDSANETINRVRLHTAQKRRGSAVAPAPLALSSLNVQLGQTCQQN